MESNESLGTEALQAGDVLLYGRSSLLGRAIRLLDGGAYSHAALFIGDGKVAEAIGHGIRAALVEVSLGSEPRDWIDVFRRKPVVPPVRMQAVLDVASRYVADKTSYAFHDVLFCAALALSRRIPLTPARRILIREILDRAAGVLVDAATRGRPPRVMCSELVYRSFLEAEGGAPGELALGVAGLSAAVPAGATRAAPPDSLGPLVIPRRGPAPGSLLDLAAKRQVPPAVPRSAEDKERAVGVDRWDPSSAQATPLAADPLADAVDRCEREGAQPMATLRSTPDDIEDDIVRAMDRLAAALRAAESGGDDWLGGAQPRGAASRFEVLERWLGHFVSPRDLEESPSLARHGRLLLSLPAAAGVAPTAEGPSTAAAAASEP